VSFTNPIVGGVTLVRPSIQSPNYVPATAGWTVNADGTVEFNSGTFRGSISAGGGTVLLNSGGVAVIQGTHDYEINQTAGFLARVVPDDGTWWQLANNGLFWQSSNPTPSNHTIQHKGTIQTAILGSGTGEQLETRIFGEGWGSNLPGEIDLRSDSFDGVTHSSVNLIAEDIHLVAATGGTIDMGNATFVEVPHRLISTNTGFDYPAAQIFNTTLAISGGPGQTVSVTYPVAFPTGTTIFGTANNIDTSGPSSQYLVRWLPVDNTKCNITVYNTPGSAFSISSLHVCVLMFCVPA